MCYIGSELWESKFDGLLALVKEYIVDVWEIRKHKLYDSDSGSGLQLLVFVYIYIIMYNNNYIYILYIYNYIIYIAIYIYTNIGLF